MNKKILFFIIFIILLAVILITTRYFINSNNIENKTTNQEMNVIIDKSNSDNNVDNIITNSEKENTNMTSNDTITLSINDNNFEIQLEQNETTNKLLELLPLEITMSDLNNNEKYYYLDEKLPTNSYSPKTIEAGDVMLYGNNCLVIFSISQVH